MSVQLFFLLVSLTLCCTESTNRPSVASTSGSQNNDPRRAKQGTERRTRFLVKARRSKSIPIPWKSRQTFGRFRGARRERIQSRRGRARNMKVGRMPTPRAPKLTRDPMDFLFWVWRLLTKPTFLIKAGKSFLLTCPYQTIVQFGDFKTSMTFRKLHRT